MLVFVLGIRVRKAAKKEKVRTVLQQQYNITCHFLPLLLNAFVTNTGYYHIDIYSSFLFFIYYCYCYFFVRIFIHLNNNVYNNFLQIMTAVSMFKNEQTPKTC